MKQCAFLCVMFMCDKLTNRLIPNLPVPITSQVPLKKVHADLELCLNDCILMLTKYRGL